MTETEWLAKPNPKQLLKFLGDKGSISERKLLLFAAACFRHIWSFLSVQSRLVVEILERCLDDGSELETVRMLATQGQAIPSADYANLAPLKVLRAGRVPARVQEATIAAARAVAARVLINEEHGIYGSDKAYHVERRVQSDLFRDIVGNPFRPRAVDPDWNTTTVVQLAQAIYDDRTFDHLPILADALEEAGCTDATILEHCRGPGPHVRGCWVVDLLLGKE